MKHLNGLASWTPGGPSAGMFFWFGDWPPHAHRPTARPPHRRRSLPAAALPHRRPPPPLTRGAGATLQTSLPLAWSTPPR